MRKKPTTRCATFDYFYEGKPGEYTLFTSNAAANRALRRLQESKILKTFTHSLRGTSVLLIALSMNLSVRPLKSQIILCHLLLQCYEISQAHPEDFPHALREALEDCCYEDKLQVYDRKTQLRMFVANLIRQHPLSDELERRNEMLRDAEGFIAFCFTEDLSGPGKGFTVGEFFDRMRREYTDLGHSLSFYNTPGTLTINQHTATIR